MGDDSESNDGGTDAETTAADRFSRRSYLLASGAAVSAAVGLAGCGGSEASSNDNDTTTGNGANGSSGNGNGNGGNGGAATTTRNVEQVTMLLTPSNPTKVRERYKPVQNMINGEIDTVHVKMKVPQSYSAIKPALKSKQAEIGMDDITLISNPDLMNVYGTTVTGGSAFYFSVMLTNPDSNIDERSDIKGKTMAFADRLSTSGSIFAVYTLKQAGLDVGDAPQGQPVDFKGVWSNHKIALEKLGSGEADAATTWGGNGMPHIPKKYKSEFPQRVLEKSSFIDTLDTESPKFRPFWWSFPIPKQPIYARKSWQSPNKEKIGKLLRNSDKELISQYYPEGYDEGSLPFTTLRDTTIETYQPVIKRLNALGIDLGK